MTAALIFAYYVVQDFVVFVESFQTLPMLHWRRSLNNSRTQNVSNQIIRMPMSFSKEGTTSRKEQLFCLLANVPRNASTPKPLTEKILSAVRELERDCPTMEQDVLDELGGNWELIWTAQDASSSRFKEQQEDSTNRPIFTWIK